MGSQLSSSRPVQDGPTGLCGVRHPPVPRCPPYYAPERILVRAPNWRTSPLPTIQTPIPDRHHHIPVACNRHIAEKPSQTHRPRQDLEVKLPLHFFSGPTWQPDHHHRDRSPSSISPAPANNWANFHRLNWNTLSVFCPPACSNKTSKNTHLIPKTPITLPTPVTASNRCSVSFNSISATSKPENLPPLGG